MKLESLPLQYSPFQEVQIGSNVLKNVAAILSVNGEIPLLVGNGDGVSDAPKIWLSIPMNSEGLEWYPLIKENFSTNKDVTVNISKKVVTVKTPTGTVINVVKKDDNSLVFTKLDLRPFGINVYADQSALYVMGNTLSKNVFKDIDVVIGIGDSK